MNCEEVNLAGEKLKTLITYSMDEVAPEKESRIKIRTEPWINNEILELIDEREKSLILANKEKSNLELRKHYNKLRNKVTKVIRKTKANFFQNKIEEHKDNPKLLWGQLNSTGYSNKSKDKSRTVLEINGEKCHEPKAVSNHYNNYFLTVAANLQRLITNAPNIYKTTSQIFKDFYTSKGIIPKLLNSRR